MENVNDLLLHTLNKEPLWSRQHAIQRTSLSRFFSDILFPLVSQNYRTTKDTVIESVVSDAAALLSAQPNYIAAADVIIQRFGPIVGLAFHLSFPHGSSDFSSVHSLYHKDNNLSITDFFAAQPQNDIDFLIKELPVKEVKMGAATHTYVNTSRFGLGKVQRKDLHNLLAICFQRDFHSLFTCDPFTLMNIYLAYNYRCVSHPTSLEGFISAILAHRGYPVSVLNGLMILHSALPNATSNDCNTNHTKAERQSQRRHDARVERALKLSTENELARDVWPQHVPQDTILHCVNSYRVNVQYRPLDVCACCGSEDRRRTGHYSLVSQAPCLETLRVIDDHILKHTPRSRFCYINAYLDGLLLDPKGIRAKDSLCKGWGG